MLPDGPDQVVVTERAANVAWNATTASTAADAPASGIAAPPPREAGLTRTIVSGRTRTIQLRRAELDARFPGLLDALIEGTAPHD